MTDQARAAQSAWEIYCADVERYPLLSAEEEKHLAMRARDGDPDASRGLAEGNLRIVLEIANRVSTRNPDAALDELVAAGNMALLRAAAGFDADRDVRFATYAWPVVEREIRKKLRESRNLIRIPKHVRQRRHQLLRLQERLRQRLEREPTRAELSQATGEAPEIVAHLLSLPVARSVDLRQTELGEDGQETWRKRRRKRKPPTPGDVEDAILLAIDRDRLRDWVHEALDRAGLTERQRNAVGWRFALNRSSKMTFDEIGVRLGVSRSRAQQLVDAGLAKLRPVLEADSRILAHYQDAVDDGLTRNVNGCLTSRQHSSAIGAGKAA